MRMPQELKTKWIEALESGEYKQGARSLCTPDGAYCCLGVLQHVVDGDVERGDSGLSKGYPTPGWYDKNRISVQSSPNYRMGLDRSLADDNDAGASFPEIAKRIKTEVEGY